MREGWSFKKLGKVCLKTSNIKWGENENQTYQYIDLSSVSRDTLEIEETTTINSSNAPSRAKKIIYQDDVIFATTRPTLKRVTIIPEEYNGQICSTGFCVLRPDVNKVDSSFISYLIQSEKFMDEMARVQRGTSYPAVTDKDVKGFEIPIPPLPEQKRIVAILDEAFDAFDRAKANIEKNIQNAEELFQSKLNEIFSQRGEGWEESKLQDVVTLKSGTTQLKKLVKKSGDIPYLKVSDMNIPENEFFVSTSTKFFRKNDIKENKIFPTGTVIFPKRGGAIATNKKRLTIVPICADLNIMGAIPSKKLLPMYLLYYFLKFDLEKISNGTSVPQINNYSFDDLKISYPTDINVQKEIVQSFESFRVEIDNYKSVLKQKIFSLKELKKTILKKAFSGELTENETVAA